MLQAIPTCLDHLCVQTTRKQFRLKEPPPPLKKIKFKQSEPELDGDLTADGKFRYTNSYRRNKPEGKTLSFLSPEFVYRLGYYTPLTTTIILILIPPPRHTHTHTHMCSQNTAHFIRVDDSPMPMMKAASSSDTSVR